MDRFRAVMWAMAMCCAMPAGATTYLPVTFDELVTRADVIFVGEVVDVRAFPLGTRDGTIIKTRVTFKVSDPLWGTAGLVEVFDFLGGEWGGIAMQVAEMPRFAVGDRRVVFAHRAPSINPIVGFTQGLLTVARDTGGVDRVFTVAGVPLAQLESIGAARGPIAATPASAMPLLNFRNSIARALTAARRR